MSSPAHASKSSPNTRSSFAPSAPLSEIRLAAPGRNRRSRAEGVLAAEGHIYVGEWLDRHAALEDRIAALTVAVHGPRGCRTGAARCASSACAARGCRRERGLRLVEESLRQGPVAQFLRTLTGVKDALGALLDASTGLDAVPLTLRGSVLVRAVEAGYVWCEELLTLLEDADETEAVEDFSQRVREIAVVHAMDHLEPAIDAFASAAFADGRSGSPPAVTELAEGLEIVQLGVRLFGEPEAA